MGEKKVETNEQQKNKPDQPKVILKPLLKGIHESPLAHFGVVGLIAEGNLPDLRRVRDLRVVVPFDRALDMVRHDHVRRQARLAQRMAKSRRVYREGGWRVRPR